MDQHLDKLREYLAQRDWRNAHLQTKWALMEAVGKDEGYLTPDDIKKISVSSLRDIDQAWNSADYRFGFQKQNNFN